MTSGDSDVDLTAMALQSLAKNQDYKNVKDSINKALNYLSKSQKNSGGFTSWGTENVESSSQVVIALSALNINAQTDKRFIKGNNTLLSAIMKYKTSDGGFTHSYVNDKDNPTAVAGKSNSMASEQTLLALSSYIRYVNGEKPLYDFTDTISKKSPLTDKDIEKIINLPKDLTTENYGDVLALLEKAQYSKNEKYVSTLKNDKAEIEKIQEKINSINTTINSLYPIDNVKISDKDKIEKVIADYNSLSSYDKTKVSGFDDTERALAVISEKTRSIIVVIILIMGTDFQSVDEYYLTHVDDIKPDSKTVTMTIECKTVFDNKDKLDSNLEKYIPKDGYILKKTRFVLNPKDTVFDILDRVTRYKKIQMEYQGADLNKYGSAYIEGINYLYEYSCGELSGWMYKVNNKFPKYGCSNYTLKDGDDIVWSYTCDLGRDVGCDFVEENNGK